MRALDDMVIIREPQEAEISAGGLILPGAETKGSLAVIVEVGPWGLGPGEKRYGFEPGDVVVYNSFSGQLFMVGTCKYKVLKASEIWVVLEKGKDVPNTPEGGDNSAN